MKTSRRKLIIGGLTLGAAGTAAMLKPGDRGGNHTPYFEHLSQTLDQASLSRPSLVIDKTLLSKNIDILAKNIGQNFHYRIVAKSLPSIPLLQLVMEQSGTDRLMLFHQPFLTQVANALPHADVLMGKPMPVAAASNFYAQGWSSSFAPERQLQWLLDSPARLKQYQQLAQAQNTPMRINIELDVGLHRGGVNNDADLVEMLNIIEADALLSFSGFMGYEPHVAKVPGDKLALRDKAMSVYQHYVDLAEATLKRSIRDLTLNAGGSPTYQYYTQEHFQPGKFPHNELAAGSCLVKPTDFDLASLSDHQPASWIATPVIKAIDKTEIPGVDGLGDLMAAWDPNRSQSFFTYGGYWKAKPASPQGLATNPVFGRSTNQEMYNGSRSVNLQQDDWIFLRPTQSEFVFLQFGDMVVIENDQVVGHWPILKNA